MGTIPCLVVFTHFECCCFAGGIFRRGLVTTVLLGVFLGITAREMPRSLSLRVHLKSQGAWRDTITVLHIMDVIVWLL